MAVLILLRSNKAHGTRQKAMLFMTGVVLINLIKDKLKIHTEENIIKNLHILRVKQCYPILMATIKHLDSKFYSAIFKSCEVISFRYLTRLFLILLNPFSSKASIA